VCKAPMSRMASQAASGLARVTISLRIEAIAGLHPQPAARFIA
jgi:hypothetical protein